MDFKGKREKKRRKQIVDADTRREMRHAPPIIEKDADTLLKTPWTTEFLGLRTPYAPQERDRTSQWLTPTVVLDPLVSLVLDYI